MNNEIIKDDFVTMRDMLNSIESKLKTHLNKQEVFEFYQPIKHLLFEAWCDLVENGKPTFVEAPKVTTIEDYQQN